MSHAHHGPHGHHGNKRQQPHRQPSRRRAKKVHPLIIIAKGEAVRSFTLRPWMTLAAVTTVVVLLSAYVGATGYLFLRDDLIAASLGREQNMRQAYEDRIAELRSQMDRVSSRQLLNQDAFDGKMQKILSRQASLSARQNQLLELKNAADKAGADLPTGRTSGAGAALDTTTTGSTRPTEKTSSVEGAPLRGGAEEKLAAVEHSLDVIEREQTVMVANVAERVTQKISQINNVLGGIGKKLDIKPIKAAAAMGGPFVAKPSDAKSTGFRDRLAFASTRIETLNVIRIAARRLPLAKPLAAISMSSGFGGRSDPFLGRQGYHTGVDFAAESGVTVSATAPGTVVEAGYNGGYGNMVDIDHGNGVITRYGHLSKILVRDGQKIDIGTKIGLVGSTGRSTGPHLHYEVRVEGDAIDPMPFIRAGGELRGIL